MPFYAVGKARQSSAEPPADILQRYPGQLGECFADGVFRRICGQN